MSKNICNICGANYIYKDGKWVCPACGAFKEEELSNEEVTLLYDAAKLLRLGAFDDAEESYRDITRKYPQNSEGYWGLVLAKYGIKYEQDYDGKMIPTCYAASYENVLNDKDYNKALELASEDNRKYYKAEAEKIEKIRKEWVERASHEQPFDIFLSYKDTELENGVDRTDDSHEAFELYTHLRSLGYNVFYSRESLKGKEGEKYEPYIFNALNTAHVMIVYGSKAEYIESTWVKNEWSRFYKRIKSEQKQSNALLVVYKGFNPCTLPRPLNGVQSLDRNSLTFLNDLDAYVARVVSAAKFLTPQIERIEIKAQAKSNQKPQKKAQKEFVRVEAEKREISSVTVQPLTANAENLLGMADAYLHVGQYDEAKKAYTDFLINDKNNGRALVGKLLATVECASVDRLDKTALFDFADWQLLENILRFAKRTDSEAILRVLCSVATECVTINSAHAKAVYEQVCAYNLACIASMREKLYQFGVEHTADINARYFIDTAILYEQNNDAYLVKLQNAMQSYAKVGQYAIADEYGAKLEEANETVYLACSLFVADSARQNSKFGVAIDYYGKVLNIEPQNLLALFGKICASIECESDENLFAHIYKLNDFITLENWLSAVPEGDYIYWLEVLLSACEKCVYKKIDATERINKVIERLLAYIPKSDDEKMIAWLKKFAIAFQSIEQYKVAQKFYALAISIDREDHAAYWGLLQAKLHCKTDDDLMKQPQPLGTHQEFQNALVAASGNIAAMNCYIDIQSRQKAWAEEQEKKRIRAKKRKKIIKMASIAMGAVVLLGGVAAGVALWYNSENQLKYEEVQGGYAVTSGKFYHNSISDKFEIPSNYNGKPVVEIGENAFKNFDKVTEFVIPYTVTNIADSAFYDCNNLQKVSIAQSTSRAASIGALQTIGNRVFYDCDKLSDFAIPYGVTSIGDEAFTGTAFTKMDIPDTVEYIGSGAFANCNVLATITVADRESLPTTWHGEWNKDCSAEVQYSLRVTFDYNGATGNMGTTEQYIIYDKSFDFPVPTKAGYTFDGWYCGTTKLTDGNGQSVSVWNFTSGGQVSAQYTANENKIVFAGNGATSGAMSEQTIKTDESASLSANRFVRKGYTFAGWATSANGNARYSDKASYKMGTSSSYTLFAVWTPNTNTVNFNANGGSGDMQPQSMKTDASAKLSANTFTRTGYDFVGWATSADGSVVYANQGNYTMGAEGSYTLYAKWTIKNYSVTYNLIGGSVSGNPAQYNIESNTFTLVNPTRAGYTFAGWTGTGLSSATQTATVNKGSTGDRTYTATWTANTNTITFHANGGEGEMEQQKIPTDATATLNNNVFTQYGYDFIGWATSASGYKIYDNQVNYTMGTASNYDLYAVWKIKEYNITYNLNGGIANGNFDTYTINTNTFTLNNPTRAGYTFTGWTGTDISTASQTVTVAQGSMGDRIYTANWMPITYSISYELNGGTVLNKEEYNIEAETFTLSNPMKTGYTFVGWSGTGLSENQKTVTIAKGSLGNRSYEAHYEIIQYQIKYNLAGGTVSDNPDTYTIETNSFTLNNPTRAGYTFAGWTGTDISENLMSVLVEKGKIGNREYTANWQANLNVILFNGNDEDSGTVERITGYTDEWIRLPKNNFALNNHEFKGWSTTPNGDIVAYDRDLYQVGVNSSTTLYAVWKDWTGYTPISTAEQLKNIQLDGKYYLTNDIDFGGQTWISKGEIGGVVMNANYYATAFKVQESFSGIFDGNNHSIYNIKISVKNLSSKRLTYAGGNYVGHHGYFGGLFVGVSGEVSNLNIYNMSYNKFSFLTYNNVAFNSYCCYFGGISGQLLDGGKITNCSVHCDFSSIDAYTYRIGGVVSEMEKQSSLQHCYTDYKNLVADANGADIVTYDNLSDWNSGSIIEYTDGTNSYFTLLRNKEIVSLMYNKFVKTGYKFVGWGTKKDGTVEYTEGQEFAIDRLQNYVTLYPVWKPNENALVFNANGGNGEMANQTITSDSTVTLNKVTYTKDGYHFIGWATEQNGEVVYADGANYTMGTGNNYTLYAVWAPNENEIIFDSTLGSGTMPNQKIHTDETANLNMCAFTAPTGYYFAGWTDIENGTEVIYSDCAEFTMSVDSTITLYAVWKEI